MSAVLERPEAESRATLSDVVLRRAVGARVYDVAERSRLQSAPQLSARLGRPVLLKREDQQPVFSFKLRGAYNRMLRLDAAERVRGVIAASAGNHAQGVALSAVRLGIRATLVMPASTPQLKVDAVRRLGGEAVRLVLQGDSYSDAEAHARDLSAREGLVFVHPFDDLDVIAGQGTIGLELLQQAPDGLAAVFVPVGGGGLAAGVATCLKSARPEVAVIGVETCDADSMNRALRAGHPVKLDSVGLFADGTAVREVGRNSFALCRQHLDGMLQVNTDAVCAATRDLFHETRTLVEPSGALALAGLKQYAQSRPGEAGALAAVVSGANINFDRLGFVAGRAEVGEQREALFAVTIPEQRGSFRRFRRILGDHDISEFNYRMSDPAHAHLFVGVRIDHPGQRQELSARLQAQGFSVLDLTADEFSKQHLRHMIGGRSGLARDEHLYRFEFPQRRGALADFLERMDPDWNISLFHYRDQGGDHGQIAVGLQVAGHDCAVLQDFIEGLGYPHVDESRNPAYRRLLCED